MALLAHRVAQGGRQTARVDDGDIHGVRRSALLALGDVPLPWAVAALTADGQLPERRVLVTVDGVLHRPGFLRMTVQALRIDAPVEMHEVLRVSGRQLPSGFPAIPGDRRLEEEAVTAVEVGSALRPGAHRVGDFLPPLGRHAAPRVLTPFPVDQAGTFANHLEVERPDLERVVGFGIVLFQGRGVRGAEQAAAHGMLAVGFGDVLVTTGATFVPDVGRPDPGVQEGRKGQRRQGRAHRSRTRREEARPKQEGRGAGQRGDRRPGRQPQGPLAPGRGGTLHGHA